MKKELLWITLSPPYDNVGHAGGKNANYYIKRIAHEDVFSLTLMSICNSKERDIVAKEYSQIGVNTKLISLWEVGFKKIFRRLLNITSRCNPFHKHGGLLDNWSFFQYRKALMELRECGYKPSIIILQWTEIVLLLPYVKQIFPNAKIVAIEEDVAFLGYKRKEMAATNNFRKKVWNIKYNTLKRIEIDALNFADLVVVNNDKDKRLIENEVFTPTIVWSLYYQSLLGLKQDTEHNKDIIFYGAMSRRENYESAIWFIEKVMPHLSNLDVTFRVIGSNPPVILKKKGRSNVIIEGFVNDIKPYFESSLCLVAPLTLGAGIKVKIIEGLSSGIPVLTNNIGIEGINAIDGQDYFHCEAPEDYIRVIQSLLMGKINRLSLSKNSKQLVEKNFNYEQSYKIFYDRILSL